MNLTQREKAFEDLYAHDQELHFKVRSRRNKLVGLWAANKMGKTGDAADKYAMELVTSFLEREPLFFRVRDDFANNNVNVPEAEITKKILDYVNESRQYFMDQMKP